MLDEATGIIFLASTYTFSLKANELILNRLYYFKKSEAPYILFK